MAKLELLCPRLKACLIQSEGQKIILEEMATKRHLILGAESGPVLELLDGKNSVQEIVARLHRQNRGFKFHTLFQTIDLLIRTDFVEEGSVHPDAVGESLFDIAHHQIDRIRFEKILAPKLSLKRSIPALFYISALVIIALSVASLAFDRYFFIPNHFASYHHSHWMGLLVLLAIASSLMTAQGIVQAVLQLFATGKAYGLALRVSRFSVNIGTSDAAIYLASGRRVPLLFHLASLACFTAMAGVADIWLGGFSWFSDVRTVAFFLTLVEMNPYLQSELRKIFQLFHREEVSTHLVPYLKNRALLFPVFASKESLEAQLQLVLYATYALAWSMGSLYFCLHVLQRNYPNLWLDFRSGGGAESISALLALCLLLGSSGYFLFDLLTTLAKNLYYPLRAPIEQARDRVMVRKAVFSDHSVITDLLRKNPLFEELKDETLARLVEGGALRHYPRNSRLVSQGKENEELFIVIQGQVSVRKRAPSGAWAEVALMGPGAVLGEQSAVQKRPATASVIARARGGALVFAIPRSVIQSTGEGSADYGSLRERVLLGQFFASSPLFSSLPSEAVHVFVNEGKTITVPPGSVITEQGSMEKSFYLLVRGGVEVCIDGKKVSELAQGDFFGEISLISDIPRTATVRSVSECILHRLDSDAFWGVLGRNIYFSMFIESVAMQRADKQAQMRAS